MGSSEHATIPSGFRFKPTDQQLICPYVYNKNNGIPIPSNMVMECDVYGEGELWRNIFQHTGEKTHYFYTRLKKKTEKGSRVERATGCCTWRSQKNEKICISDGRETKHIGSVRSFTLKPKKGFKNNGRWVMHEYRLDGCLLNQTQHNDFVLCRIKKKKELQATTANLEQQKENNANIKINDAALKAELNGNSNHTEPMQPMDMDTTESISPMEGLTCNNFTTAGIMIAHSGLVKDANKNMQVLSDSYLWDTTDKLEGIIQPPLMDESTLVNNVDSIMELSSDSNLWISVQGLEEILPSEPFISPQNESGLVDIADNSMEVSSVSNLRTTIDDLEDIISSLEPSASSLNHATQSISSKEPSALYLEETRVTTQGQMGVMSPQVFMSLTTLVPASTFPLPSGSNACRTLGVDPELVWDRQHPVVMEKNISSSQCCQDECGLINNADNNMEVSLDSDLWTTMYMYQLEDIMSIPELCANQMTFSTEKGSLNISDIGVKTQGQLAILPPELIWDHQLLSQVDENFWSRPYF